MKSMARKICVTSSIVWVTACSGVSFTPYGNPFNELDVAEGYSHESFAFNQDAESAKVDVLFVIDNSTSMLEEQSKLSAALASFIGSIARLDWQIGITTSDVSNGPHGLKGELVTMKGSAAKILNKNIPDYEELFKSTVVREEVIGCTNDCPSADERPLEAIRMAIDKQNGDNAGFFRPDADLVTIILSDEDEGSDGLNAISAGDVLDHFTLAFGVDKRLTGFGILIQPGDTACYDSQVKTGGHYGLRATELATLTGGVTGSICDSDYLNTLASIGERVREVSSTVTLRELPMPETIQLRMSPFDPDLSWSIEGQTIRFNKLPRKGTRVDIVYMPTQQR